MARSSGTFSQRMQAIGETIERRVVGLQAHVMDVVQRHIIAGTPVSPITSGHSGRARSNWWVTTGTPSPLEDLVGPFDPSGRMRMESNTSVLQSSQGVNVKFYLTNNLDYIGLLNAGSSQQAPANFVRLAILEGIAEIKEARLLSG